MKGVGNYGRGLRWIIFALALALLILFVVFLLAPPASDLVEDTVPPTHLAEHQEIGVNNKLNGDNFPVALSRRKWQDDVEATKQHLPNVVHVMWCQNGSFEFKHFLAVKSALNVFEPTLLYFHYDVAKLAPLDEYRYNKWLDDLVKSVPNFVLLSNDTNSILADYCSQIEGGSNLPGIYLSSFGIFLHSEVVVTSAVFLNEVTSEKNVSVTCSPRSVADLQEGDDLPDCFTISIEPGGTALYPATFFEPQNAFARFVRTVVYATPEPLILQPNPETLIPLLCHYIWLGGGNVEFLLYLSILSCLNIVKADAVLVHGDEEPRGPLWQELVTNYPERLNYVYRPQQPTIFGRPVHKLSPMSDILRMDILLKYGGIYTDWDAVWIKPLDASLRQYETLVAFDWPAHLKHYPDTLNLGVMATKPNSAYLRHLQDGLRDDFIDEVGSDLWCYICLKAYKVYEKYPATVRVERHLQVIAYQNFYHPAWVDDYKDVRFEPPPGSFDWRRGDTNALHWTWPTPVELRALKFLRRSNTTAAQAARHILQASGITDL